MKQNAKQGFKNKAVAKVFAAYPDAVHAQPMKLRAIVLDTAADIESVGPLEETLKWGQPSYLTTATGSGSTVRIGRVKPDDDRVAMYFHCQTDLVATFRELYPTQMEYGGNRSILFNAKGKIPEKALRHCIGLALTYHARKSGVGKKAISKTAASDNAVSKKKQA